MGVCGRGLEAPMGALQMGAREVFRSGPQTLWVILSPGAPGHGESQWVWGGFQVILRAVSVGCAQSKKMHMLGVGAAPPLWMLFESRPPRLLPSELVTLVTVTGEDVTLAPPPTRGPFTTSFYVNQPFTRGGGSPACLGFKTSGRLGFGERRPYM